MTIVSKDITGTRLIMNPIGKLFSESQHYIEMQVCPTPTCNCGEVNMILKTEIVDKEKQVEFVIPLDLDNELIRESSKSSYYYRDENKKYTLDLLSDMLCKEDWLKLKGLYYNYKKYIIEAVNPEEIDFEFEEEDYENNGVQIPYFDIFPCSVFEIEFEENYYIGLDYYCKNPMCDCSDMSVDILKVDRDNPGKTINFGSVIYDYKRGTEMFKGTDQALLKELFILLKNRENDFDSLLENRNKNLRVIYKNSVEKYSQIYNKVNLRLGSNLGRNLKLGINLGRNDLCYCGSGKKYKKCCLNK